ncbi:MAG: matrixin family metalloprotease [Verrucomicrobiales bacterium]
MITPQALAMSILVDYTYDTNNFFDTQEKKDALEAATNRYSQVITSSLTAVTPAGNGTTPAGWRIGFNHPATGIFYEVSTAASAGSDPVNFAPPANEYGFGGLAADTWILYAGGRNLLSAGEGGTGTGSNFFATVDDPNGPYHRGVISTATPGDTFQDLAAWGGSIAFDTAGTTWHFDHTTAAPTGTTDFYTIALHEVGHALGLSLSHNQWKDNVTGSTFTGSSALAAYNADNGTSLTGLEMVSSGDPHWKEDTYDSYIFSEANPNLVGTVGTGVLQDMLMEPSADFTATVRRLELTNVDVAALQDLGWSVVPEPSTSFLLGAGTLGLGLLRRRLL